MEDLVSSVQPAARDATRRNRVVLPAALAVACYCVLAVLAYRPISPINSGTIAGATTADPVQAIWYLEWIRFALLHGHNPFFTNFLDYPRGVNLATNTLSLPLGLAASPMTLIFGPVATYNLLLRLALAASATSMCFVLRRWTRWWPAAFAGGLLYGFGAYMSDQDQWHLTLAFVPIPPLILWCLARLLGTQRRPSRRLGILLGLLCSLQFLIHAEIFTDCALVGAVGLLALSITHRHEVMDRAHQVLPALGWGVVCFALVCAYPIWLLVAGARHISGPISPTWLISQEHIDLLSPIRSNIVTRLMLANGHPFLANGAQVNFSNNTAYLGLPLAALIVILAIFQRRVMIVCLAALLAVVSFIISLGPRLTVNGANTGIPLPAALLAHIQLLNDMIWDRWSLLVTLFACVVFSVGLDRCFDRLSQIARSEGFQHGPFPSYLLTTVGRLPTLAVPTALCAIAAAALIPLTGTYPLTSQQIGWPAPLVSSLRQSVPEGGVVLALPYVTSATDSPMAWQALDGMQFRIVGGYATVPSPLGGGAFHQTPTRSLTLFDLGVGGASDGSLAADTSHELSLAVQACEAVPEVVKEFSVNAIVVWPTGLHESMVRGFLKPVLGMPSRTFGQALVWYNVKRQLAAHPQCGPPRVLTSTLHTRKDWAPFSPRCWTALASSGTVVKTVNIRGRGKIHVVTAVRGRPNYTFAETDFAKPADWSNSKHINVIYKGTGSGKTYGIYFEFAPTEEAKYTIVDKSDRWQMVSLPTAMPGIAPTAWAHLLRVGLALSPKSAAGTIAIGCPVPS